MLGNMPSRDNRVLREMHALRRNGAWGPDKPCSGERFPTIVVRKSRMLRDAAVTLPKTRALSPPVVCRASRAFSRRFEVVGSSCSTEDLVKRKESHDISNVARHFHARDPVPGNLLSGWRCPQELTVWLQLSSPKSYSDSDMDPDTDFILPLNDFLYSDPLITSKP